MQSREIEHPSWLILVSYVIIAIIVIIITSATVTSYITTIGYPSDSDFRFSAPLVVLEIGELTDDFETALISLKRKIKKGILNSEVFLCLLLVPKLACFRTVIELPSLSQTRSSLNHHFVSFPC